MSALCPHCGFNLTADAPIERDRFLLDPRGAVAFGGLWLGNVPPQACRLLHTLAKADGRPLSFDAIMNRVTDGEQLRVPVRRARAALLASGAPDPIETVWGYGLRWRGAALARRAA